MFIRTKIQGIKVHIMTFKYKSTYSVQIISKIESSSSIDKMYNSSDERTYS